jgi:5-carboxymethyl-2-hydroxymuconate isomerase
VRVLAYPAPHFAVADGGAGPAARPAASGDYGFVYLNLRMGRGRSAAVHQAVGEALTGRGQAHFAPPCWRAAHWPDAADRRRPEVFDAKHSNLHPLFNKP